MEILLKLIDNTEETYKAGKVERFYQKDFVTMSGADIAVSNKIAVYPKPGWYRTRKKLHKENTVVR